MGSLNRFMNVSAVPKWLLLVASLGAALPAIAADPTVVAPIADQVANEDDSDKTIGLAGVFDDVDVGDTLTYSASSSAAAVVSANVAADVLTLDFQPDQSGLVTITVRATDTIIGGFVEDVFTVDVAALNDNPFVIPPSPRNVSIPEDSSPGVIDLTGIFGDVDVGDVLDYTVTGNDNSALVTATNIAGTNLELTLAPNATGTAKLTVLVEDLIGANASIDINVTVTNTPDAPVLVTPIADRIVAEDGPNVVVNVAANFSNPDPGALTFSIDSVSNAALFDSVGIAGSTITADLALDQNGTSDITVRAVGPGGSITDTFTVTVTPVNDTPTALAIPPVASTEDTASVVVNLAPFFSDVDVGDTLTFSVVSVGNVTLIPSTSVGGSNVTLNLGAQQNGSTTVTVRATDIALATVDQTFSVNVAAANDAPTVVGVIAPVVANEDGGSIVINLAGVFADVDIATNGDVLTLTALPSNPSLFGGASGLAGTTLTLVLAPNQNGTSAVDVTATDIAGADVTTSFNVTINPVNDAPTVAAAVADVVVAEDAGPQNVDLTGAFADVDIVTNSDSLTLTVDSVSNPALFQVAPAVAGTTLSFTPAANTNGTSSVTVRATDLGLLSTTTTFNVTVNPQNDAPTVVAAPAPVVVLEDAGALIVDLSAVFTDLDIPEGDTLTLAVTNVSNPGLFSTPPSIGGTSLNLAFAADQNGAATLTIEATDTGAASVTTTLSVTVTPVNDTPVVASPIPDQSLNEDDPPLTVDLSGVFDDVDIATNADVLTLTVTANTNPTLFQSVAVAGNSLVLTLVGNANGSATLTVTASDLAGANVSDSFLVTVNSVDDIPAAVDDTATMDEDGAVITIAVLANDTLGESPNTIITAGTPEGHSESPPTTIVDSGGSPVTAPNGTVTIVGNAIEYLPKPNFAGTDFFNYAWEDADGQGASATVTITVNALPDPPQASASIEYTMTQATVLDVVASGLLGFASDVDGDALTVAIQTFPTSGASLTVASDGSFAFTPLPAFIGIDTFEVVFSDGTQISSPIPVNITVTPTPPPAPPPPAGEVEFDLDLANVPLEDSVSAEANVLIVMDDSGSMDWTMMVDLGDDDGRWRASNSGWKSSGVTTRTETYEYHLPLASNTSDSDPLPSQEAIDADSDFNNNNFGFWRARTARFNPIYYNPEVRYVPWAGLNRSNVEFPDASPTQAPLDPYDFVATVDMCNTVTESSCSHIDLTANVSYTTDDVPRRNGDGNKDVTTNNYYIPQYYTSTATGALAYNSQHTRVEIRSANAPFVGGVDRADCAVGDGDPNTCTYAQEIQNFANWFTYYRSREYTAKGALGRAVNDVTNVRMGYAALNDTNERIPVESMNASFRVGAKAALIDQVYSPDSRNSTPLRAALDKAGKYFECLEDDSFDSDDDSSPGDPECPVFAAPEGICQANFALLFSDGLWNQSFSGDADENHDGTEASTSTPFDGGRYSDTVEGTLADVAMYYYERDLHPSLQDGVPTMERDRLGAPTSAFTAAGELMHQHMKTYTIGFGLSGSVTMASVPTDFTQPFAWPDPFGGGFAKVDDMLHAAVNGRGDFLSANNPVLLSQGFQSAFQEFTSGSVSVSAVAFNSTALREQTVEYRGFFNLKFNTGDLRALDVDPSTGVVDEANPLWRAAENLDLIPSGSRVIVTYDRVADAGIPFRWADLNANQQAMMDANEVAFVRGVRSNEEPGGTFRARPLVEGLLGDIVHSAPQFVGGPRAIRRDQAPFPTDDLYSDFSDDNATRMPIVYVAANDGMLHGFDAEDGDEVFAYVPNKLIDTTQRFQNDLDQLASIVYAHRFFVDLTPTVEDVYMPASKSTVGKSWNTVLIGGLRGGGKGYYALNVTDPETDFTSEAQAQGTVLWEFTDADDTYPVDALGNPIGGSVGAQVDAGGQPVKDLGYTFSQPQIVLSNITDTGTPVRNKWMAVFGNGYNSSHGFAKLFALFIEEGLDGWAPGDFVKLDTLEGPLQPPDPLAGFPNGLGTPAIIDEDLNGTADLAYAGDVFGNLYRFDLCARPSSGAPCSADPSDWKMTKLFQATYDNGGTEENQPITTQPFVFKHPDQPGFVIVFGTGSYITEGDATSTEIQTIYGIWDRGEDTPVTAADDAKETRLVEQVITNFVDESQPLFQRLRAVSDNAVDYIPDDTDGTPGVYGWFVDLDPTRAVTTLQGNANPDTSGNAPPDAQFPGERAIRRFVPRGDAILVTTVIPRDANTCLRAPPGAVFPIDLLTGGNPKRPILDLNNDGRVDDNDLVTVGGVAASAGFLLDTDMLDGTVVDPSVLLGTGAADFLFLSGGSDQQTIRIAGPEDPKTGRLSWRELDDTN